MKKILFKNNSIIKIIHLLKLIKVFLHIFKIIKKIFFVHLIYYFVINSFSCKTNGL